jgi:hypothetical protein
VDAAAMMVARLRLACFEHVREECESGPSCPCAHVAAEAVVEQANSEYRVLLRKARDKNRGTI